ncbi:MAG: cytochrome c maturation protein CcmE [Dehalococcoidia bacterium]|nr:cytochrome c maturation protein CcmE [Dehalococcoidia bacterium]
MAKYKKFVVGGAVVLVAVLVLGYVYFMGMNTYYYNVGDLLSKDPPLTNQTLRVSGTLSPDPVKDGLTWYFTIRDMETDDVLPVVYSGTIPNTFEVGRRLVVEGQYDADKGIFEGSNIIVKCSSKFEPIK